MRLSFNLIILRDGVWRVNKNLGRSQYENTPDVQEPSPSKPPKKSTPKKHEKTNLDENYGLDEKIKAEAVNKKYRLKEGELIHFVDSLNNCETNVTHNNKRGSISPLKRSYKAVIEDSETVKRNQPEYYQEFFVKKLKAPDHSTLVKFEQAFFH